MTKRSNYIFKLGIIAIIFVIALIAFGIYLSTIDQSTKISENKILNNVSQTSNETKNITLSAVNEEILVDKKVINKTEENPIKYIEFNDDRLEVIIEEKDELHKKIILEREKNYTSFLLSYFKESKEPIREVLISTIITYNTYNCYSNNDLVPGYILSSSKAAGGECEDSYIWDISSDLCTECIQSIENLLGEKSYLLNEFLYRLASIESITVTPNSFIYGISPNIIASVKNADSKEKNIKISLYLDGTLIQTKDVQINPNSFDNIEFIIEKPAIGAHTVRVGKHEASFKVKEPPYLRLDPINERIGIGSSLTISGTSNEPDGTNVLLTVQSNGNILAQQSTEVKNGRFSKVFDTNNAKELIYSVSAKTSSVADSSIEVTFIKLQSKFEITDFSLSEPTVIVGTPITATVTVKNTGNIAGSKDLTLYIDGFEKKRQTVNVEPNEIKRVTFSIEEGLGSHEARVESYTKEFTIRPTPNIVLDSIKDTRIGDKFTVNGRTNMPDGTSILITANADSAPLAPQTAASQGGSFSVAFDTNGAKDGIYQVNAKSVSGTSSDIVSVRLYNIEPIVSISLVPSQKEIIVGQSAKVIVTLTTSGRPADQTLILKMDGKEIDTRTVNVDKMRTVEFTIPNPSIGTHIIDVNGYQTQFTVASIPSSVDIGFLLKADKTVIKVGEEVPIILQATNIITKPSMTVQLILTVPSGMSVTSTEFTQKGAGHYSSVEYNVNPGDTRYINVGVKANQEGTYKIEGRIVYYFGGNKTDEKDEIQTLYITVNTAGETVKNQKETGSEQGIIDKLIQFLKRYL